MKGTIAILGCLFAAYAAPLFANEVPLILEETIQLPVATPYWDVMPTWDGTYHWVHAAFDTSTETTFAYYQSSDMGSAQECVRDLPGSPVALSAYFDSNYVPTLILTANRRLLYNEPWCNGMHDTCECVIKQCVAPNLIVHRFETYGESRFCSASGHASGQSNPASKLQAVFPTPPPPDNTTRRIGEISGTTYASSSSQDRSNSSSSSYSNLFLDFGDSTEMSALTDNGAALSTMTAWNGDRYIFHVRRSYSDWQQAISPTFWTVASSAKAWHIMDQGVESYGTEYDSTFSGVSGQSGSPRLGSSAVVYDMQRNYIVGMVDWSNFGATLVRMNDATIINRLPTTYDEIFASFVLIGDASEQFLALRPDNLFDIIRLDDGQIWGQTSALDPGFDEMKIIGRYHNETRRLVVRYGSELRIYRFGEPILDAEDARPELPNELSLSAYPNPFNPTTMIAFELPKAARATLLIYDLNGRFVKTLLDEQMSAEKHEVGFDGAALPSGIYFARLSAGNLVRTQKLVLLK